MSELRLCETCEEYRVQAECPRCGRETVAAPEHPRDEHAKEPVLPDGDADPEC